MHRSTAHAGFVIHALRLLLELACSTRRKFDQGTGPCRCHVEPVEARGLHTGLTANVPDPFMAHSGNLESCAMQPLDGLERAP